MKCSQVQIGMSCDNQNGTFYLFSTITSQFRHKLSDNWLYLLTFLLLMQNWMWCSQKLEGRARILSQCSALCPGNSSGGQGSVRGRKGCVREEPAALRSCSRTLGCSGAWPEDCQNPPTIWLWHVLLHHTPTCDLCLFSWEQDDISQLYAIKIPAGEEPWDRWKYVYIYI